MLLVKCKCGCSYTLDESKIKIGQWIRCPQCEESVHTSGNRFQLMENLSEKGFTIQRVPETAKFSVTFEF